MKLTTLLLMLNLIPISANVFSQNQRFTYNLTNVQVKEVLDKIEAESNYKFLYRSDYIEDNTVSLSAEDLSLEELLTQAFGKTGLTYKILDDDLVVVSPRTKTENNQQNEITISGTVFDASSGETLPGVNITISGTSTGTSTDFDGKYSITADMSSELTFSYIGYISQTVKITGESKLDIMLVLDVKELDEIIVVGYGTTKKSDLTGSVSAISTEKFAEQNVSRLDQVLQGRATGVQVTNVGGSPGGDVRIRIRGANSVLGDNNPLYVVDGFVGADFNTVNPNDIESIQVLKDAASTAIYGSRGSNGVIIVTTRKGEKGKMSYSYEGQYGVSKIIDTYDLLDAADFAETVNAKNAALGLADVYTQAEIDEYRTEGGTDWQDAIYRMGSAMDHQLSISGGNDNTTFMVSGNYHSEEGIVKNSGFDRYTLRSNLSAELSKKLTFRLYLTGTSLENNNTRTMSGTGNPIAQSLAWAPTTPIYDEDGNYTITDPVGSLKSNPVALIYDRDYDVTKAIGNLVAGVNYEIIEGLALDIQYAVNYQDQKTKTFYGDYVTSYVPTASATDIESVTQQGTYSLSYKKIFNETHTINAVAVMENQQFIQNNLVASSSGLTYPELGYYNLGQASSCTVSSSFTKWTLLSFLGRINYDYKDKYLLTVSIRRDGSSKFRPENRWSTFPAFALGWNLGNEEFIKSLDIFSTLKVRGSWGWTGSQAIESYATQSTYSSVTTAFNSSALTSGIRIGDPGNTDLKWETTEQKDLGLEIGLLRGRITFEFDYFIKNTTDLLLNWDLPGYVGGGSLTANVGEIKNNGFELNMGATAIATTNFKWKTDFNYSHVENTVVSLGGVADILYTGSNIGAAFSTESEFIYMPGEALGSYWGLKYLGTWKPDEAAEAALYGMVPGDARYEDLDGNYIIDSDDYQIIGNGLPKSTLGWNNTFSYKNLTLNIFFQGVFGVDKLNYSRASALIGSGDNRQATLSDILDRYIPGENETSDIPAFSNTSVTECQSTMFMESGNFLRLKNLSLSYAVPVPKAWPLNSMRVSFNATNLLTFTNYKGLDPESSNVGSSTDLNQSLDYGAYPSAKTYTLGVNITF